MKITLLILILSSVINAQISKILIGNKTTIAAVPATYEYYVMADGDTFLTSESDTFKVRISYIEFEQFNKSKENENNIIVDKRLAAVLPERKRTA